MCGEKDHSLAFCASAEGSPPHVRGKAGPNSAHNAASGITPAYAGKRLEYLVNPFSSKDHPRVCGEKPVQRPSHGVVRGSPPRMRGKVSAVDVGKLMPGITPAYAGKSRWQKFRCHHLWDHPRVCGEKHHQSHFLLQKLGSPPRMRGKDAEPDAECNSDGITPAYAGKRQSSWPNISRRVDHPRVCGEKTKNLWLTKNLWGSPPRMRGKDDSAVFRCVLHRITPAYAGKSITSRISSFKSWDHPRVCGEKILGLLDILLLPGSPPRMRGKGAKPMPCTNPNGITPAYAGKRALQDFRL